MNARVLVLMIGWLLCVVAGVACSGEDVLEPFDDIDVVGRDTNPEGDAYPTDDWGMRPRNGRTPGQRVPNFSFQGYPDSNKKAGLQVVSFADYYDPLQLHHKLLFLVGVSAYCPHCQAETRDIVANTREMQDGGVRVVQVMLEGGKRGRALSIVDLDRWVDAMRTEFTVLIDADARRLGSVAYIAAVPWNVLIDTRSMEVLAIASGVLNSREAAEVGITWVDSNSARP